MAPDSFVLQKRITPHEGSCTYTNLPKNTLKFVNLGKILSILFGEDLEFSLLYQ